MEFLSLLALVVAAVALLRGAFRAPPAPQVIYIPVPQPRTGSRPVSGTSITKP